SKTCAPAPAAPRRPTKTWAWHPGPTPRRKGLPGRGRTPRDGGRAGHGLVMVGPPRAGRQSLAIAGEGLDRVRRWGYSGNETPARRGRRPPRDSIAEERRRSAMKTEQFLRHHGIAGNPFSEEDAQTDTVFKRRCLVKIHHPAWNKFFGSPADPSTALVFGEKG